jgi:hypothetical protein
VLEFGDLLSKVFTTSAHKISTHDGQRLHFTQPISISDDRTGTLTSQLTTLASGDKKVDVTVDVSRTIHDQPMNVNKSPSAQQQRPAVRVHVGEGRRPHRPRHDQPQPRVGSPSNTVYILDDGTTTPRAFTRRRRRTSATSTTSRPPSASSA